MSRDRVTELASRLRDAARLQDPYALACIELVKLSGGVAQESLVTAEGDDMLRLQGAARHMAKLHKELTTQPPGIRAPENK